MLRLDRVDYELTPLGVELQPVMRAIKDWAERYIEDVEEARSAYDARAAGAPLVARSG